jgi:hypothetical protein
MGKTDSEMMVIVCRHVYGEANPCFTEPALKEIL